MRPGEEKAEARLNLEFPAQAQTPESLYYEDKVRMALEEEDRFREKLLTPEGQKVLREAEAELERTILGIDE